MLLTPFLFTLDCPSSVGMVFQSELSRDDLLKMFVCFSFFLSPEYGPVFREQSPLGGYYVAVAI